MPEHQQKQLLASWLGNRSKRGENAFYKSNKQQTFSFLTCLFFAHQL